jgi:hypothetical protein
MQSLRSEDDHPAEVERKLFRSLLAPGIGCVADEGHSARQLPCPGFQFAVQFVQLAHTETAVSSIIHRDCKGEIRCKLQVGIQKNNV